MACQQDTNSPSLKRRGKATPLKKFLKAKRLGLKTVTPIT